jgi:hypothetical protein
MAGSNPAICRIGNIAETAAMIRDTPLTLSSEAPLTSITRLNPNRGMMAESSRVKVSPTPNPIRTLISA